MARAKPQPLACPCCKTGKPGAPSTHVSVGTWYETGPSLATWPNAEKYSPFSTKTWLCGSGASASVQSLGKRVFRVDRSETEEAE